MALFPANFLEDLKAQTDIVSVIGEVVSLRKTGATYKGLCPFHQEKTPSFNVNKDKGFFNCFGCQVGGDVVKFVEMHEKLSFPEAVRHLAKRAGIEVPDGQTSDEDRLARAERDALVTIHEQAAAFFRDQLAGPAGERARRELVSRGLTPETIQRFGYGYAPAGGRDTLQARLTQAGVPLPMQLKSKLVREMDDGRVIDQFRNRLMIPIARDTGAIVAFGGRALDAGQVPKYLNSPESLLYTKGRTLYGLDVTKAAIREHNYCVLVEGYFDLAQVWQAGVENVAALCGTALTSSQAKLLKRFASKVVLCLDPDAAGQSAAVRSSELLVTEGFRVNVATLPGGADPDVFIREQGGAAYVEQLKQSRPYLDFVLDRASAKLDTTRPDSRKVFLDAMLQVAATIPDPAARDVFADAVAHRARVTESVIRDEIRKAAAQRKTEAPAIAVPATVRFTAAEQGLLWALVHRPVEALAAIAQIEPGDLDGLLAAPVVDVAASLAEMPPDLLPGLLAERLNAGERAMLDRAAGAAAPAAPAADCVGALKRERLKREIAAAQDEIDQLERSRGSAAALEALWKRKKALLQRLEALDA